MKIIYANYNVFLYILVNEIKFQFKLIFQTNNLCISIPQGNKEFYSE